MPSALEIVLAAPSALAASATPATLRAGASLFARPGEGAFRANWLALLASAGAGLRAPAVPVVPDSARAATANTLAPEESRVEAQAPAPASTREFLSQPNALPSAQRPKPGQTVSAQPPPSLLPSKQAPLQSKPAPVPPAVSTPLPTLTNVRGGVQVEAQVVARVEAQVDAQAEEAGEKAHPSVAAKSSHKQNDAGSAPLVARNQADFTAPIAAFAAAVQAPLFIAAPPAAPKAVAVDSASAPRPPAAPTAVAIDPASAPKPPAPSQPSPRIALSGRLPSPPLAEPSLPQLSGTATGGAREAGLNADTGPGAVVPAILKPMAPANAPTAGSFEPMAHAAVAPAATSQPVPSDSVGDAPTLNFTVSPGTPMPPLAALSLSSSPIPSELAGALRPNAMSDRAAPSESPAQALHATAVTTGGPSATILPVPLVALPSEAAAFAQSGAATHGQTAASVSVPIQFASPAHEPFGALDSASAPGAAAWTRTGTHSVEAGFNDPSLGWVGVRADLNAGGVHAALVPVSADAAQVLAGQIPGLHSYLSEQHVDLGSLTLSAPEGSGLASGDGSEMTGGGQPHTQQNDPAPAPPSPGPPAQASLRHAAQTTKSDANLPLFEHAGVYISVLA
jgi:hypothetical protein